MSLAPCRPSLLVAVGFLLLAAGTTSTPEDPFTTAVRAHARNGTIIILESNSAFHDMTLNWIEVARRAGVIDGYLIVALDGDEDGRLKDAGVPHYHDRQDVNASAQSFRSSYYNNIVFNKWNLVAAALGAGVNVILTDVDVLCRDPKISPKSRRGRGGGGVKNKQEMTINVVLADVCRDQKFSPKSTRERRKNTKNKQKSVSAFGSILLHHHHPNKKTSVGLRSCGSEVLSTTSFTTIQRAESCPPSTNSNSGRAKSQTVAVSCVWLCSLRRKNACRSSIIQHAT